MNLAVSPSALAVQEALELYLAWRYFCQESKKYLLSFTEVLPNVETERRKAIH